MCFVTLAITLGFAVRLNVIVWPVNVTYAAWWEATPEPLHLSVTSPIFHIMANSIGVWGHDTKDLFTIEFTKICDAKGESES